MRRNFMILLVLATFLLLIFTSCCNCDKAPSGDVADTGDGAGKVTDAPYTPEKTAEPVTDKPYGGPEETEPEDMKYYVPESVGFGNLAEYGIDEVFVKNMSTGIEKTFIGDEAAAIVACVEAIEGHSPISGKGIYGYDYSIKFYSNGNLLLDLGIIRLPLSEKTDYLFSHGKYERSGRFDYQALYTFADTEHYNELLGLLDVYFGYAVSND